jgi:hypothetical protein
VNRLGCSLTQVLYPPIGLMPAEILALARSEERFTATLAMNTQTSRVGSPTSLAAKRPPVIEALDVQSKEINELHGIIGILEERLRTVRNLSECNKPPTSGESPEPVRVDECIERRTRQIALASTRLNELIGELVV